LSKEASAEPGQWNTDRAPYQRGIHDALNDSSIETIVMMSSAQVGKTEMLLNIVGYYIDYLHGCVKDPRSRDSGNTLLHKTFPGGHITMAGANSPASLASRPIRIFLADEVDRYPLSAGTEGDPLNLGAKRTTTFFNRKKIYTSTPTIKGASRIEDAYNKSDMRRYYVPCKHCGEKDIFKWANVKWDKDEDGEHMPETAFMVCEHCGGIHQDHEKTKQMLAGGEWIADKETDNTAGFHLNELYSPWKKWSEVVKDFLDAKGDTEQMKTWTNTSLGETFEEAGDQIDDGYLHARREQYAAEVPAGAVLLTMGVDVQADRLEAEIVGWGAGEENWNIDYKVFRGDVTQPEVWDELAEMFDYEFTHESGNILTIATTTIDSGYQTQLVYDFVYRNRHRRVYAVKGVEGAGRPIISQSIAKSKKNKNRKVDLYIVGVDDAKLLLASRLRISDVGSGYCHFPLERNEEYFAQLTAEKMITKFRRGFPIREWVKTRPRNEATDCRVYSHAGVKLLNPNWQALVERLEPKEEAVPAPEETVSQRHIRKRTQQPRKGGFVNRW